MGPSGTTRASSLGAVREGESASVALTLRVASADAVVSPLTGLRSALLRIEILERFSRGHGADRGEGDIHEVIGAVHHGDLLVLADEDGRELTLLARACELVPWMAEAGGQPLTTAPPEIVPLLRRATGRGLLCFRELSLRGGDLVRVTAVVEATRAVTASGYRDAAGLRYVARDDLAPVVLEELPGTSL
ncbi:MAG: hypothetical protein JWP97_2409 [Labilithrix sp.]|nr:hypothetical protein [Labilithrix sp.]